MDRQMDPEEEAWGFRFNRHPLSSVRPSLSWASKRQNEKMGKRGLVFWNRETRTITHLTATYALSVLGELRKNDEWLQNGIVVGEPAVRIELDDPDRAPRPILSEEQELTPERTQSLLVFLQERQAALEAIRDEEEEDRKAVMARVIQILWKMGVEARKKRTEADS